MFRASDFKKGTSSRSTANPTIVESIIVQKPSARGAVTLYKVRFRNLQSKRKVDQSLRGDDMLDEADFERRPVQYLYGDAASITFMDLQDYSQFTLTKDEIEDEWPYLTEGLEGIIAISSEGRVLGLQIRPSSTSRSSRRLRPSRAGRSRPGRNRPRFRPASSSRSPNT